VLLSINILLIAAFTLYHTAGDGDAIRNVIVRWITDRNWSSDTHATVRRTLASAVRWLWSRIKSKSWADEKTAVGRATRAELFNDKITLESNAVRRRLSVEPTGGRKERAGPAAKRNPGRAPLSAPATWVGWEAEGSVAQHRGIRGTSATSTCLPRAQMIDVIDHHTNCHSAHVFQTTPSACAACV